MALHIFRGKKELSSGEIAEARGKIEKNLAIIGFMGSGKTTIGKKISSLLGKEFLDTDEEIVNKVGLSVTEIFNKHSEAFFRDMEHKILLEICATRMYREGRCVIACGGGISLNPMNVKLLKDRCIIVKLAMKPHSLLARLRKDTSRPLITLKSDEEIIEMHNSRYKYYLCADVNVDVDDHSPEESAAKVLHAIMHFLESGCEHKDSDSHTHVFK